VSHLSLSLTSESAKAASLKLLCAFITRVLEIDGLLGGLLGPVLMFLLRNCWTGFSWILCWEIAPNIAGHI